LRGIHTLLHCRVP